MGNQSKHPSHRRSNLQASATKSIHYEGSLPPPSILRGFDEVVPGTAARLVKLAEEESAHRRGIESKITDANINTQQQQVLVAKQQSSAVARCELIGLVLGAVVCLSCVAGCFYLGTKGLERAAIALAVIPTAGVISAFTFKRKSQKH